MVCVLCVVVVVDVVVDVGVGVDVVVDVTFLAHVSTWWWVGLLGLISGSYPIQPRCRCAVGRLRSLWRERNVQCRNKGK